MKPKLILRRSEPPAHEYVVKKYDKETKEALLEGPDCLFATKLTAERMVQSKYSLLFRYPDGREELLGRKG